MSQDYSESDMSGLLTKRRRRPEEVKEQGIGSLEDRPQGSDTSPRWIELYVRADSPAVIGERFNAVIDRLEQLQDEGTITAYRLRQWPPRGSGRVASREPVSSFSSRQEILAEFDAWAERHGYTLQPAFRRKRNVTLGRDEESAEHYRVPLLTLACYEGETLHGIIPCADGQHTYTVADFLAVREPGNWVALSPQGEGDS